MSGKEVEKAERIEEEKPWFCIQGQDKCQEHDEEWEFYCEDHWILCCGSCVSSSHTKCKHLDNICKDAIKNDANISDLENLIEKLETSAKTFIEELKQAKLATSSKVNLFSALRYIDDMKNFVCTKFDNLKTSLTEQFKLEESKLLDTIDKKISQTKNIADELHQKKQFLMSTKEFGTPENLLTASQLIEKDILPMQSRLKNERDTSYTLDCSVVCSSDLSYVLKYDNCFATFNIDKLPFKTNESTNEIIFKLQIVSNVKLSKENEDNLPLIADMDYFADGRLALVDSNNYKMHIMNETFEKKQDYRFNSEPTGVSVFSEEDVVVALASDYIVEVFKVSKTNDITLVRTVKTAFQYYSLSPMNETTFLALSYHDQHPLKMLTLEGKETKFNTLPKKAYSRYDCSSTYITDKDIAVLTDEHNNAIYMYEFGKNGVVSRKVKDNKIKNPKGVCVGPNGCLLICSYDTDSIVQLLASGEVVASHKVIICPTTVCVSKDKKRLTVASTSHLQSYHISI